MKIVVGILIVTFVLAGYSALSFLRKVRISAEMVRNTIPYSLKGPHTVNLLVLGDSTAVGVGARTKEESLAALVAGSIRATNVENRAISGARVQDLQHEIELATERSYTYILVGIGANDVVRFKNPEEAAAELAAALHTLPAHDHLIVYMAGNVGATKLFPWIMRGPYLGLTLKYHTAFKEVVSAMHGTYVDLYVDPDDDPFVRDPERYLAADGYHPTSEGYLVWFEKIVPVLE